MAPRTVVETNRPAEKVRDFLHLARIYVWAVVGSKFSDEKQRHGVAFNLMRKTGEIHPDTPITFGIPESADKEALRKERSIERAGWLLRHPEYQTTSQDSAPDPEVHGSAFWVADGEYILGASGLGRRLNEAVGIYVARETLGVSQDEWMAVAFRSGSGPNQFLDQMSFLDLQISEYLRERHLSVRSFAPDFEKLHPFTLS